MGYFVSKSSALAFTPPSSDKWTAIDPGQSEAVEVARLSDLSNPQLLNSTEQAPRRQAGIRPLRRELYRQGGRDAGRIPGIHSISLSGACCVFVKFPVNEIIPQYIKKWIGVVGDIPD
uniref:Uncharacterized protein n=1 Tax=Knipowitschia caucasica TaxID=637954 RepID=A0AAV2MAD1_KNICA